MKKMIKLSLVAAVAVAGLTTTSSAANLTDAVKNTQLNGYVRYRLNTNNDASTDVTEETKAVMKFTTKVNDSVKANVKLVSIASTNKGQGSANTAVTEGNFVISAAGATVIAGLQTSQSPFFANNGDTRSHGVTVIKPLNKSLTLAGAYYTTTVGGGLTTLNAADSKAFTNNVTALAAIGKVSSVNYALWYASVEDGADVTDETTLSTGLVDASATSIELNTKIAGVNVQLMNTVVTNADVDTGLTKLVASGKAGKVSYVAAYAATEKDGGMVTLDQDDDAKSDLAMGNHAMSQLADTTGILLGASMPVGPVTVSVNHLMVDNDTLDGSETDVKVAYKMSKNFGGYVRIAQDGGDLTSDNTRIEVKYTF